MYHTQLVLALSLSITGPRIDGVPLETSTAIPTSPYVPTLLEISTNVHDIDNSLFLSYLRLGFHMHGAYT